MLLPGIGRPPVLSPTQWLVVVVVVVVRPLRVFGAAAVSLANYMANDSFSPFQMFRTYRKDVSPNFRSINLCWTKVLCEPEMVVHGLLLSHFSRITDLSVNHLKWDERKAK